MAESAADQYANGPLPEHLTVPGWRIAVIVSSFAVALPAFLNGAYTGLALGFWNAVLIAIAAGLILSAGGTLTSIISVRTRLTTYLLVQRSFGRFGAALVNIVIAFVLFGWFGVNVSFFGSAMAAAAKQIYGIEGHFTAYVIGGSVLMTASTVFGFRTLDKLAVVTVPLLGVVMLAVCVAALRRNGIVLHASSHPPEPMTFGVALSALVGGNMATVATMPDLSRYIHTRRGAVSSMLLSFPLATPVMMIASALPALATGETDIMALIVGLGFGVAALAALVLSSWIINASNLYSAGLSLSATFPTVRSWVFILLGGVIGASFALAGIIDAFIPFLLFLGVIIPPIAAIYVIDGFTLFRTTDPAASIRELPAFRWPAVGTWIGSVALVLAASHLGVTVTGVPMFDATIVAAVGYAIVLRLARGHASARLAPANG
ncbi:cytosine permease [Sphingomonas oryzagri]|uniref:Cytosine permease n=1 Tax=Sphingomonas oryzagri TaxID=3042314 RepID=A0ABT6MXI9_9SPHN|nr:cytosine permease [Sphingomonas oryzagri]MDH7637711.1 cytosine permease [Sphingomonas oryzagri]